MQWLRRAIARQTLFWYIFDGEPVPSEGYINLDEAKPGLGLTVNEDSLKQRRVARVEGDRLLCLGGFQSVYELAQRCLKNRSSFRSELSNATVEDTLAYDPIYRGESEWRLLPPIDVPENPWRCLVSGTRLTHLGSTRDRQAMHAAKAESLTHSMKMFQAGLEFGRPEPGKVGIAPEWFYKGNGNILRAHLEPLDVPFHAEDGGEETEVAAIYIVDEEGTPHRIGSATGNEFSDHVFEKKNYLNLAGSKLRSCSLGPELVVDLDFQLVRAVSRLKGKARNSGLLKSLQVKNP